MENTNNSVTLTGRVAKVPEYSHSHCGEKFYGFVIEVKRLSDAVDSVNVTISEKLLDSADLRQGADVEIEGQYRSYNNYSGVGNKLVLTVFVQSVRQADEDSDIDNPNKIYLNGYVCKPPIYRTTPFGREITDMIIAVNRAYGKSDYIPCIAWGRNAKYASKFEVGDNVEIWGRIQSRQYIKRLEDGDEIIKTAYEISVSRLGLVEKQPNQQEI